MGSYAVTAPATFDAVFALPENAPEHYSITLSEVPQILLRAQGPSTACPNMPGLKPCDAVAADAPLVSFAADMPSNPHPHRFAEWRDQADRLHLHLAGDPRLHAHPEGRHRPAGDIRRHAARGDGLPEIDGLTIY
ncbi:MAG: hypothetical protein WDN72_01180 [Alphaproteobacteria bacterium]